MRLRYYANLSLPDVVIEQVGEGIDTIEVKNVRAPILPDNVENLIVFGGVSGWSPSGSKQVVYTGNSLDNIIDIRLGGESGIDWLNVIDGGIGADTMYGSYGINKFIVDNVGDVVVGNKSGDTVQTNLSYILPVTVERLVLTGSDSVIGTGNEKNNTLDASGNSAANILSGGMGDDVYILGAGDSAIENFDEGVDRVETALTHILSDNIENLTLIGNSIIDGTGNALDNLLIGNYASNVLTGGLGDDTYVISSGDTVVEYANEGIDSVKSDQTHALGDNFENLTLTGTGSINGAGNDLDNILTSNGGANILTGGLGDDTYSLIGADDTLVEYFNEGIDTIQAYVDWTLGENFENLVLGNGLDGTGNALDNIITGGGVLLGMSGNDTLIGSWGDNVLDGGEGLDVLMGGAGNDIYIAGVGDTIVEYEDEGVDLVNSNMSFTLGANLEDLNLLGTDSIDGTGNELTNTINGNDADNTLMGFAGADTINAWAGNDVIYGGAGKDTLNAGTGSDVIYGGSDDDILNGGATYTGGGMSDRLYGEDGNDILTAGIKGQAWLYGGNGNDTLMATQGSQVLMYGGAGNDTLRGSAGNETLDGGGGVDYMYGREGDDIYVVDNIGDIVIENVNEGIDTLQSSITYTLDSNVENLILTGTAAINGRGNSLDNLLMGNIADNTLDGAAGNNVFNGGVGNDVLNGSEDADTYIFNVGDGMDTIDEIGGLTGDAHTDTIKLGAGINESDVILTRENNTTDLLINFSNGTDQIRINDWYANDNNRVESLQFAGNTVWDVDTLDYGGLELHGSSTNTSYEILWGLDNENDRIYGEGGIDILVGKSGNDQLYGGAGDDILVGYADDDDLYGGSGKDMLLGGDGNDRLDGGLGGDTLKGEAGNDILGSKTGDDFNGYSMFGSYILGNEYTGGIGDDLLNGSLYGDTYYFNIGDGMDTIDEIGGLTGEAYIDKIKLGAGISEADVTLSRENTWGSSKTDLLINFSNSTDQIRIKDWYGNDNNRVESLVFADGSPVMDVNSLAYRGLEIHGGEGLDSIYGLGNQDDRLYGENGDDVLFGYGGKDQLYGGNGADTLIGFEGDDELYGGNDNDALYGMDGYDVLDGGAGFDKYFGGAGNDILGSKDTADYYGFTSVDGRVLGNEYTGGMGNDTLKGTYFADTYYFNVGDGIDTIDEIGGSDYAPLADEIVMGTGISELDLMFAQNGNDLGISRVGSTDRISITDWYTDTGNQVETVNLKDGDALLNTQVDQLIQAMATFSVENGGISWEQAIADRPDDVQVVISAYWQPAA